MAAALAHADDGARYLGGGTNLVDLMRLGVERPAHRRPGTGCQARAGEHRNLAILGHSDACVATHPPDMAVALAALDASVEVVGPGGERTIPIPGFHRLPGDQPQRDTVLEPAELITGVTLPPPIGGARSAYRKVRERSSFAFALVSVGAVLALEDGRVSDLDR